MYFGLACSNPVRGWSHIPFKGMVNPPIALFFKGIECCRQEKERKFGTTQTDFENWQLTLTEQCTGKWTWSGVSLILLVIGGWRCAVDCTLCCGLYVFSFLYWHLMPLNNRAMGWVSPYNKKHSAQALLWGRLSILIQTPPPHKIIAHTVTSLPESYFMLTLQIPPKVLLFFHLQYHHLV